MGQLGICLRKTQTGYAHWCPACEHPHVYDERWTFDGNLEKPTFSPSMKVTSYRWDVETNTKIDTCCHYFLTAGKLNYCGDCTHRLKGQIVDLPELPVAWRDIS